MFKLSKSIGRMKIKVGLVIDSYISILEEKEGTNKNKNVAI